MRTVAEGLERTAEGRWFLEHGTRVEVRQVRRGRPGLASHSNASWLAARWPRWYVWWTGYALAPGANLVNCHSWVQGGAVHIEVTHDEPSPSAHRDG